MGVKIPRASRAERGSCRSPCPRSCFSDAAGLPDCRRDQPMPGRANYSAAPSARGTCALRKADPCRAWRQRIAHRHSGNHPVLFEDWPYILHIVHWMDRIYKRARAGNAKRGFALAKPLKMDCRQAYYYTMPCSPGLSYSSFSWLRA